MFGAAFFKPESSIEMMSPDSVKVSYDSWLKLFWLASPWLVGGLGVIIAMIPALVNIHTPNVKIMWLLLPGVALICAAGPLFVHRQRTDDFLILDRTQRTIRQHMTIGGKTLERCVGTFDNVLCVTLDAHPSSDDDGEDNTTFWGCIVYKDGTTTQITAKAWKGSLGTCVRVSKSVAEVLQCDFVDIQNDTPVMQLTFRPDGTLEVRHRKPWFFDQIKGDLVPILKMLVVLACIMGIFSLFDRLLGNIL